MFTLSKSFKFEAAHQLINHDGACRNLHGHSYTFKLVCRGNLTLDGPKQNMVVDYAEISRAGKEIEDILDHKFLNDVFGEQMTTAEYIARWIYDKVSDTIPDLWAVEVSETESTSCWYSPQESRLYELGNRELSKVKERLFQNINVGAPEECWEFNGSRDKDNYGYCAYTYAGTNKAHRLVMWLAGYDITDVEVLHSCDNPPCCNRRHLRIGTHSENEKDKDDRNRRPKGENASRAVLTDAEVAEIWAIYQARQQENGIVSELASFYNVSPSVLSHIVRGRTWNHITGLERYI
jgi:6-pyruvoyltetrahydropterin/6-carboxytetrahydropterin synthase